MKSDSFQKNTNRNHRFHWWYIVLIVIILLAGGGAALAGYVRSRIYHPQKYAANWTVADSGVDSDSSSAAEEGLDSLDAGNFSKGNRKDYPIIKVKQKDPNIENILLIGIDNGAPGGIGVNRADSIIVVSLNKKSNTVKLSSLLRDTKTYFPNTGTYHKLNAAFSYGGPGLQTDVINYAYKLDIQKYIQFDFSGFQNIIDAVGGVPIYLTAKEASYSYINVGTKAGTYNLNGAHALGYTRTRYIDTDFMRTQRQRNVILAVYTKLKDVDMMKKLQVANQCLSDIQTNIPTTELLGTYLPFVAGMNTNIQQIAIPTEDDGMYTTEKSPIWFWNLNWNQEVPKLQKFIYGN